MRQSVLMHNVLYCQVLPGFHGWLARPSPGYFLPFRPETSQRCRLWLSCSHGNRRDARQGRPFHRFPFVDIIRHNFWASSGRCLSQSYTAKLQVASGSLVGGGPPLGAKFSGKIWIYFKSFCFCKLWWLLRRLKSPFFWLFQIRTCLTLTWWKLLGFFSIPHL